MTRRTRIGEVGSFVPDRIVTDEDLTRWMDTSDEWIRTPIGYRTATLGGARQQTASGLGLEAVDKATPAAGITPADLDMIPRRRSAPTTSSGTARFAGVPGDPAIDIRRWCRGFVSSMAQDDMFIRGGMAETVLVVGVETHSKGLDVSITGHDVPVLFGDGAAVQPKSTTR